MKLLVFGRILDPKSKSKIITRKLTNGKEVKEKVVVTWRESYAKREKIRRDGAIKYVQKMRSSAMKRVLIGKNETKYYDVKVKDYAKGYWETFEGKDTVEICSKLGVDWTKELLSVNVLDNLVK